MKEFAAPASQQARRPLALRLRETTGAHEIRGWRIHGRYLTARTASGASGANFAAPTSFRLPGQLHPPQRRIAVDRLGTLPEGAQCAENGHCRQGARKTNSRRGCSKHYPQSESTSPRSRQILADILDGVPEDEQAKIGKISSVYTFDVAKLTVPA